MVDRDVARFRLAALPRPSIIRLHSAISGSAYIRYTVLDAVFTCHVYPALLIRHVHRYTSLVSRQLRRTFA